MRVRGWSGGKREKEREHFSEEHLRILNYRDVVRFAHEHDGNQSHAAIWDKRTAIYRQNTRARECSNLLVILDSDSIILDLNELIDTQYKQRNSYAHAHTHKHKIVHCYTITFSRYC